MPTGSQERQKATPGTRQIPASNPGKIPGLRLRLSFMYAARNVPRRQGRRSGRGAAAGAWLSVRSG